MQRADKPKLLYKGRRSPAFLKWDLAGFSYTHTCSTFKRIRAQALGVVVKRFKVTHGEYNRVWRNDPAWLLSQWKADDKRERENAHLLCWQKLRNTWGAGAAESIDNILADTTIDTGVALTLVDVDLTVSATETCNQEGPFVSQSQASPWAQHTCT